MTIYCPRYIFKGLISKDFLFKFEILPGKMNVLFKYIAQ
jgi:hypothetical protein